MFTALHEPPAFVVWNTPPVAVPAYTVEVVVGLAALAIGISVDDTLHLLFHYQGERRRGAGREAALGAALRVTGAPVILTTTCLVLGFLLCLDASMMPVWRTGMYLTTAIAAPN